MDRFSGSAPVAQTPVTKNGIWTKEDKGLRYCTEASEFTRTCAPFCPHCNEPLTRWGNPTRGGDGDALFWRIAHPCGATLTIFND